MSIADKLRQLSKPDLGDNKTVHLIVGAPASGKSWVCNKLAGEIHRAIIYVDHDDTPGQDNRIASLVDATYTPFPIIYDPCIGISTLMRRHPHFDWKLYVIQEELEVLKARVLQRGGKVTNTLERRAKRMKTLAKKAEFTGTSSQVLDYLAAKINAQKFISDTAP